MTIRVAVIGGGPAGSIAARTLASEGIDVILIEKNPGRDKPCGGGIPSPAFDELNLPKETIERKVTSVSITSSSDVRVDVSLEGAFLAMVRREIFDSALMKQAENEGTKIIKGTLTDLRQTADSITIRYTKDGIEKADTVDVVIAADGINSTIAKIMGLKRPPVYMTMVERIKVNPSALETYKERCEFWYGDYHAPKHYSWVFPKGDHISVGTGSSVAEASKLPLFLNRFKERLGGKIDGGIVIKKEVFPIPALWRDNLVAGRVLFVGDAAGLVMPVSSEGIYYAMKSGEIAAKTIIDYKENLTERRLHSYQKNWNRNFASRFKLMGKLRDYFYRGDKYTEKLVELHKKPSVQKASMDLWLSKNLSTVSLLRYIGIFREILRS